MTNVTFNISVTVDDIHEENESFILTINDSLPSRVTHGNLSEVTVTIKDTTGELLTIKLSSYKVDFKKSTFTLCNEIEQAIFYG